MNMFLIKSVSLLKANQCMGMIRGHDGQRSVGKFGIYNDHRESGPRFNVSSEGRCFLQYSVPVASKLLFMYVKCSYIFNPNKISLK